MLHGGLVFVGLKDLCVAELTCGHIGRNHETGFLLAQGFKAFVVGSERGAYLPLNRLDRPMGAGASFTCIAFVGQQRLRCQAMIMERARQCLQGFFRLLSGSEALRLQMKDGFVQTRLFLGLGL